LPDGAADVLAAFVVNTYATHACALPFSPRLIISAPGANSGKTSLLRLLAYLCRNAEPASEITVASFFRLADEMSDPWHRQLLKTMLIDECDHHMTPRAGTRNALVAAINAGHNRTAAVIKRVETIAKVRDVVRYNVFAPVALAGIGDFAPPTLKTRSFIIRLKPKMRHEQVEEFIPDLHGPALRALRAEIAQMVIDLKDTIRECRPVLDRDLLNNRAHDNAATLLKIAESIGPICAARVRAGIKALTRGEVLDQNALLLGDIASIINDPEIKVGEPSRPITEGAYVFSADLCALLVELYPDRDAYQGFNPARLATMLRAFDIEPEQKRRGKQVLRAYRRDAFQEWFVRYGFADIADAKEPQVEGSDVAPEDAIGAAFSRQEEPLTPPLPVAATPLHQLFPNAHHARWARGDKRKGDRLRDAADAAIEAGKFDADAVAFTSALFWLIETRDGQRLWASMNGGTELELWRIKTPGLVADNANSAIVINETKTLDLPQCDYERYRSLVSRARRLVLNA
jgi:hypothetical protein